MSANILRFRTQPGLTSSIWKSCSPLAATQHAPSRILSRHILRRTPTLSSTTFSRNTQTNAAEQLETPKIHRPEQNAPKRTLIVSNLAYSVEDSEIRAAFAQFGPLLRVWTMRNPDNSSKGYGFILFENLEDAIKARNAKDLTLSNRPLRISYAQRDSSAPVSRKPQPPSQALMVANLSPTTTEVELLSLFSPVGPVTHAWIVRNPDGTSRNFAFVIFSNMEDAIRAHDKNDFTLHGRALLLGYGSRRVTEKELKNIREEPKPTETLFVGNIHREAEEADLELLFGQFGDVTAAEIAKDKNGVSRGFGWVKFANVQQAIDARRTSVSEPIILRNASLTVRYFASSESEATPTLHVSKLPFSADDADLEQLFSKFGELKGAHIIRGPDGKSLGYGFVTFVNVEDATKARSVSQTEQVYLIDRNLAVNYREGGAGGRGPRAEEQKQNSLIIRDTNELDRKQIYKMLDGYNVRQIRAGVPKEGMKTNIVYINFNSVEDASKALGKLNEIKLPTWVVGYSNKPAIYHEPSGKQSNFGNKKRTIQPQW